MSKTCPICERDVVECGELVYDENFGCDCCEDCTTENDQDIMYNDYLVNESLKHMEECAYYYGDDDG